MTIDWSIGAQIAAPIIALIVGWVFNHFFSEREKLISHYGHVSAFTLKAISEGQKPTQVNTHSIIIRNAGRKTSKNIRVGHSILPDINIYPDIDYSIRELPGGGTEIVIPSLVPKKEITISYLYFPPVIYDQINTHVESDEGPAKIVNVKLHPEPPKYVLAAIWALMLYGVIGLLYTAYALIS